MHGQENLANLSETICHAHLIDDGLAELVASQVDKRACSYCGRTGAADEPPFAVSMNEVSRHVFEAVTWLYHDGYDEFFHEGFQEQYDTDFVVEDVAARAIDMAVVDEVLSHLADAIEAPEFWVDSGLHENFLFSWEAFAETVKYRSRFVYIDNQRRPGREEEPPVRISRFLDGLATYVQADMMMEVRPGEKLFRARMTGNVARFRDKLRDNPAMHLGPAPDGRASAGRLNPEGVGLFYGATTANVAVKETALHSLYDDAMVGGFIVQRPPKILDFTRRPALPSIFRQDQRGRFSFARFADDFVDRLTQPVRLTGVERVEYVVTRIVGEYFRWVPETRLDGIAWESHLLAEGEVGKNLLVWASADDVQSDPAADDDPSRSELWRTTFGQPSPMMTLSSADVSLYRAKRVVDVGGPYFPGDDDSSPMFMNG